MQIDLFISPAQIDVLTAKVFLHPVYRQTLLYFAKHQQIKKFTLIFKDKVDDKIKSLILQDQWLAGLNINFQISELDLPEISILNVPYGSDAPFQLRDTGDIPQLRKRIAHQMRIKAMTPVAKHINKRISVPISMVVARTNISPNQITFFAMLWSVAGALCFFWPAAYFWAFTLFQINSILDGTDGEVARMNLRFSDFGKKFDVYCDYITSVFLVFGEFIGYSLLNPTKSVWIGSAVGTVSLLAIGIAWLIAIKIKLTPENFNDVEVICHKRLKSPKTTAERILSVFLSISHRDFYILAVFILSLFELFTVIHYFLVCVCIAWFLLTLYSLKICGELKKNLSRLPGPAGR